jgi:hypothetical protein
MREPRCCTLEIYAPSGTRTVTAQLAAIDIDMTCAETFHTSGVLTFLAHGALRLQVTGDGEGGHDYAYVHTFTVGCKNPFGPYPIWIRADDGNDGEQLEHMVPGGGSPELGG